MSADDDRLASIEQRYSATIGPMADDLRWLLSELRASRTTLDATFHEAEQERDQLLDALRQAERERDRYAAAAVAAYDGNALIQQANAARDEAEAALARVRAVIDSRRDIDALVRRSSLGATGPSFVQELDAAIRGDS